MKFFLIAGEASGDLHASRLIEAIKRYDGEAEFKFLGGDKMMAAAGVAPIIHYRDMAYMGFVDVAKHLPTILGFMSTAKKEINAWNPDHVILVDYPSFNLKIAKYAHKKQIKTHYFISPKVWVWKEWRVKSIKRYVDRMYCILPFEVDFYRKHDYEVTYVGNPTVGEINAAIEQMKPREEFIRFNGLDENKPIIALVPGSRLSEINSNLPIMIEAAKRHPDYQAVIAAAPSVDPNTYYNILDSTGNTALLVENQTWDLIRHSRAAIVTSGTATLEAAMLNTPQVACFRLNGNKWLYKFYRMLLKGDYVTLPNLIANEPVIPELLLHNCTADAIDKHLTALLADSPERTKMLEGYDRMSKRLGTGDCCENTASLLTSH